MFALRGTVEGVVRDVCSVGRKSACMVGKECGAAMGVIIFSNILQTLEAAREVTHPSIALPIDWHRGWSAPIYMHELNTFLCTHPKAACTSLRSMVMHWSGDMRRSVHWRLFGIEPSYNTSFIEVVRSDIRASEIINNPHTYTVAFVRDPLFRLISYYVNKILIPEYADITYNGGIRLDPTRSFTVFTSEDRNLRGHGFPKFIKVVHQFKSIVQACGWDEHIDLQSCRCGHRYFRYELIGKAENLTMGIKEWLQRVGREDLLYVTQIPFQMNKSNGSTAAEIYASLSPKDLELLEDVYREDYKRFNYSLPTLAHTRTHVIQH